MPLKQVDLTLPLQPLDWFVPGLLLRGYLNFVASLPGQGKTTVLTALAWQASRPGGEFLGEPVSPGATIYVDFDAPGDGRSVRYWLDKHRAAYPDGDMSKIHVLEPDPDTYGMGESEFAELANLSRETRASLIIVDSFMAAFPTTDPAKLTAVQGPLWYMRRLASETGAAVILIDHLPKPVNGEVAGVRGIMGSVAKPAQARAVHLLTRVPPAEVQGRNVLRWDVSKMSFAAMPEPFGVELVFEGDALRVEATFLPESHNETKTEKAVRAMVSFLELNPGRVVGRKELLDVAIKVANVKERSAAEALRLLQERLGNELMTVGLPGRGNPTGYRLARDENTDNTPELPPTQDVASLHQKTEMLSPTEKHLVQTPLHKTAEVYQKPGVKNGVEPGVSKWGGIDL